MRQVVHNQFCSRDSGKSHLQADAGATEPFRRAINESLALALAYHLTRDTSARERQREDTMTNDIANAPSWYAMRTR